MALKFNPAFLSDEESIGGFVVRLHESETIIDALEFSSTSDGPAPHILIVGSRGAGKTTLCRRIVAETRSSLTLNKGWQAIFLSEESYSVTTPGEFFLECVFQLKDQAPEAVGLDLAYEHAAGANTEHDLLERSLKTLREFAHVRDKRFLILVENFHTILDDQMQGARGVAALELLKALNDPLFGVLATTVSSTFEEEGALASSDYARIDLHPLTLGECLGLWEALTHAEVDESKLRPLQILTGGSPRLLHILAEFMRTPSLQDLMANLNYLIDQNTEYFKSQLDALPTLERKVFATLLDTWDPSTAKQVASLARVNTNTASAMLARLTDRGAVVKRQGQGRIAIYYAAERLFNIYYLMRRRSHPSNRVRALVSFMMGYYDGEDLVETTVQLVLEACTMAAADRCDHHSTFDAIMTNSTELVQDRILSRTPSDFISSLRDEQRSDGKPASDYLSRYEDPFEWGGNSDPIKQSLAELGPSQVELDDPAALLARARIRKAGTAQRRDIETALKLDPRSIEGHLMMIRLEATERRLDRVIDHVERALDELPAHRALIPQFVSTVMQAADKVEVDQLLAVLSCHSNANMVEPLIVAIGMIAGNNPLVAKEIKDVAFDIIMRHSRPAVAGVSRRSS
jgi:hypothetical protein